MNSKRLIRILIISQWIILIAVIISGAIERRYVNDVLRTYVTQRDNAVFTQYQVALIIGVIFLIAYMASSIGLLFYKKWGRWLYLYSNICGLAVVLFMGTEVVTPIAGFLDDVLGALVGLTIGILYFSDAKKVLGISNHLNELQAPMPPQDEAVQPGMPQEKHGNQELLTISDSTGKARLFLKDFWGNIKSGIRASLFLKINCSDFRVSVEQLLALVVVNLILSTFLGFAAVGVHGDFNYHYLPNALFYLPLMMLLAYCIARFETSKELALTIPIALVSASFPIEIVGSLIGMITDDSWLRYLKKFLYGERYYHLFAWWGFSSFVAVVRLARPFQRPKLFKLTFFVVLILPLWFIPRWNLWTVPYNEEDEKSSYTVAKEEVFYAQPKLLEQKLTALTPGRKGVVDLYFVGFGGYSYEDVFMKEINVITKLFDERFDTSGRSIGLINNSQTVSKVPIATRTSLERAVKHIGEIMDTDEDIIFIYLTSHGSEDYKLSVSFWPLELNDITPAEIKRILNESSIKWKVIAISACYSGGFIDILKDETTVVMTAADAKNSSFGCSNDSDFTYFGKAYFDNALRKNYSFIDPFDEVKNTIHKRELDESKKSSNPQLYIGSEIRKQLEKFEERLKSSN